MNQSTKSPDLRFANFVDDWILKRLDEIGTVIRGSSPRPQGDRRYYGGTVPRLMVADVTRDGKYVTPRVDFLTEEGARLSRPCKAGTLTIVCSGTVGIPSILAVDACIHDGFLALIDIDENVSQDYVYHQLSTLRDKLEKCATHGGVFTNLTTSGVKAFEIAIPSYSEQLKIAAFLSAIDQKVGQLARKKELLLKYKKSVMQQIFDQRIRFKDNAGNDFPAWEDVPFQDLARLVKEKFDASTEEGRKCIELEHLDQDTGRLLGTVNSTMQRSIKNVFRKDDILFGKLRPYLKKYWHADFDGVCSTEIWVMRARSPYLSSFLFYLIQSAAFLQAANISSGSKMPRAEWDVVSKNLFSVPADEREQSKISNFLAVLDERIELSYLQLEGMKNFKQGLLQQMLV